MAPAVARVQLATVAGLACAAGGVQAALQLYCDFADVARNGGVKWGVAGRTRQCTVLARF